MAKYDCAVVIGRFQPFHNGHAALLGDALKVADKVLILVGSSFCARNIKNPFDYEVRSSLINAWAQDNGVSDRISFAPIVDNLYNDSDWISQVQGAVEDAGFEEVSVCIVGHHRDSSSEYLDWFPRWDLVEAEVKEGDLNATNIRTQMFLGRYPDKVPEQVQKFLRGWMLTTEYQILKEEHEFVEKYQEPYKNLPFPPTFITTDAVTICNGHILLIKRKMQPGKGLWALPGGFLDVKETIENCIIRELKEETRISVSKNALKAALKGVHVFDAPSRSIRGRTVTHAGLIILHDPELPRVRGGDDASHAYWVPVSKFWEMSPELYEDHFGIGNYMLNRV